MTEHDPDCTCVDVAEAARAAFAGREVPPCSVHDSETVAPTSGTPLALNDDSGLAALISASLGAPVTTDNTHQENS